MDKTKFTLGKFSFPVFFATNCTHITEERKIMAKIDSLFRNQVSISILFKFYQKYSI
jgi:hypothetical protein